MVNEYFWIFPGTTRLVEDLSRFIQRLQADNLLYPTQQET